MPWDAVQVSFGLPEMILYAMGCSQSFLWSAISQIMTGRSSTNCQRLRLV